LAGEVFGGDLCEEVLLVVTAENGDLFDGDRVKPALDDTPDRCKSPGCIDEVEFS
jgi:hypothetical protein